MRKTRPANRLCKSMHDLFNGVWRGSALMRSVRGLSLRLLIGLGIGGFVALSSASAQASSYALSSDFQNRWFTDAQNAGATTPTNGPYENYFGNWPDPALTNASTPLLQGNASVISNAPSTSGYQLEQSSFAHPVETPQADIALGDAIDPPPGVNTALPPAGFVPVAVGNNPAAYYESPDGAAFWVPSTHQVISAQPNATQIGWIMFDGSTNTQFYFASAAPRRRPARVFWTEEPYDITPVLLDGLFPVIHYNSEVPPPVFNVETNHPGDGTTIVTSNLVSGIWIDDQNRVRANNVNGIVLLEYYTTGTYEEQVQPAAIEVIEVLPPQLDILSHDIGTRLLPQDTYWAHTEGEDGLIANVLDGLHSEKVYQQQNGPKANWVFGIDTTTNDPWSVEISWEHIGLLGVRWPYEVDWYSIGWPIDPQRVVYGATEADTAAVIVPDLLSVQVPCQAPVAHVDISDSGKSLTFNQDGLALLQYHTHDDVWFETIRSMRFDDPSHFDSSVASWDIGDELIPLGEHTQSLTFSPADTNYVEILHGYLNGRTNWTFTAWVFPVGLPMQDQPIYSEGQGVFTIARTSNDAVRVSAYNQDTLPALSSIALAEGMLSTGTWHYLTVTFRQTSISNGLCSVSVDDVRAQAPLNIVNAPYYDDAYIAASLSVVGTNTFAGGIERVSIWRRDLSTNETSNLRYAYLSGEERYLLAWYPFDEGQGTRVANLVGSYHGRTVNNPNWRFGIRLPPSEAPTDFPGYIHRSVGTAYNVNHYAYPDEHNLNRESHIFPVNRGVLEVWWAEPSRQDLPEPVHYPSLVQRYDCDWPTNAPQIVIASGKGTADAAFGSGAIYRQPDAAADGYNPNEEHALFMGSVAYALRNDLNLASSSAPYVLIDYLDGGGAPAMALYEVVDTNEQYQFSYDVTAGDAVVPPMPVGAMPLFADNYYLDLQDDHYVWQDRNQLHWAIAAPTSGVGVADMRFFYAMQSTFDFPGFNAADIPAVGDPVPWNDTAGNVPRAMRYNISWPDDVPELKVAQTLTTAADGLPEIWNQLSTEILYEQATELHGKNAVDLIDPVCEREVALDLSVIDEMTAAGLARQKPLDTVYIFNSLAPSIAQRLFYDPDRGESGKLVLKGVRIEPLTGDSYLMLNVLSQEERQTLYDFGDALSIDAHTAWLDAVADLPGKSDIVSLSVNTPHAHAALSAGNASGTGYVTLAFNSSTDADIVPQALPISLSVIKVVPELYNAPLEPIEPPNALDDVFSLRVGNDFAGAPDRYNFQWRWAEPAGGLPPGRDGLETNSSWQVYADYGDFQAGALGLEIEGGSPFALADHYFAVRYRAVDTNRAPTQADWSDWSIAFAPGWIERVVRGITPFEQRIQDMIETAPDLRHTMIAQAGPPYEGPVALNPEHLEEVGLIQIYRSVMEDGIAKSIDAGLNDPAINQALLDAASRLRDLYTLLANEAYADALDPTIVLGAGDEWLGFDNYAADDTALFAFQNQVSSLLEEELALLRGRDDTLEPDVNVSPIYNRMIWNFTQGIDAGEPVYALNYNIQGDPEALVATVTAEDAKRLYPQGHGDAWGHALSAIQGYYRLLGNSNFTWRAEAAATLIGNAAVSEDTADERKFSEAALLRARIGEDILDRTWRQHYESPNDIPVQNTRDTNTNRAWHVDGWACRAGQGAYFDWVTANSLMVPVLTNMTQIGGEDRPPEGIEKIDRQSLVDLRELALSLSSIQQSQDRAVAGISPLGLVPGVVPFDISPAEIDAGQTHFEQIYARALQALRNADTAFNRVKGLSIRMRAQADSILERTRAVAIEERAFHNELIRIFGRPYTDDVGPTGTYPEGYTGPDLVNYAIVETHGDVPDGHDIELELTGFDFSGGYEIPGLDDDATPDDDDNDDTVKDALKDDDLEPDNFIDYDLDDEATLVAIVRVGRNGFRLKPESWSGTRPVQGEIQLALSEFFAEYYRFEEATEDYKALIHQIDRTFEHLVAGTEHGLDNYLLRDLNTDREKRSSRIVEGFEVALWVLETIKESLVQIGAGLEDAIPKESEGFVGPFPEGDLEFDIGVDLKWPFILESLAKGVMQQMTEMAKIAREGLQDRWTADMELAIESNETEHGLDGARHEFETLVEREPAARNALMAQVETLLAAWERVRKVQNDGQLLLAERATLRAQAAQRMQISRYTDMTFRQMRDEALRKYKESFELAARYTFLAAQAYDYETGLLTDSDVLSDIVKARTLGPIDHGQPLPSSTAAKGGLADILARLAADWAVVESRFGFNNPDTQTSRFSFRRELFRVDPTEAGDDKWAAILDQYRVNDLRTVPEFVRYCRPFSELLESEPGIVIPFNSSVVAGRNFFDRDLAAGDSAYDASRAATKIRSVGIWFTGYNATDGLANEPHVYLIPVGEDVQQSMFDDTMKTRHWRVVDQALPLPYNVGTAEIDLPDWKPFSDSLSESFGTQRRFASLRAYHDDGFDPLQCLSSARLIGRSVWNTQWLLIIPGRMLLSDPNEAIERFVNGVDVLGERDGNGIKDIKLFFQTYSISGE